MHGNTVTSALWTSGRMFLDASFKYHRPQGILEVLPAMTLNALMQKGET